MRTKLAEQIKAYGDRRGEEERAKALADAATEARAARDRLARSEMPSGARIAAVAAMGAFAVKLEHIAAAPSGDAKGIIAEAPCAHGVSHWEVCVRCRVELESGDAKGTK